VREKRRAALVPAADELSFIGARPANVAELTVPGFAQMQRPGFMEEHTLD
jgi:hypothetical protein